MAPPDANATKPIPSWCAPAAAAWWSCWCRGRRPVGGRHLAPAARWAACVGHAGDHACSSACHVGCPVVWAARRRCVAASLLELPLAGECNVAREAPELHVVLADVRWQRPDASGDRQPPGASLVFRASAGRSASVGLARTRHGRLSTLGCRSLCLGSLAHVEHSGPRYNPLEFLRNHIGIGTAAACGVAPPCGGQRSRESLARTAPTPAPGKAPTCVGLFLFSARYVLDDSASACSSAF